MRRKAPRERSMSNTMLPLQSARKASTKGGGGDDPDHPKAPRASLGLPSVSIRRRAAAAKGDEPKAADEAEAKAGRDRDRAEGEAVVAEVAGLSLIEDDGVEASACSADESMMAAPSPVVGPTRDEIFPGVVWQMGQPTLPLATPLETKPPLLMVIGDESGSDGGVSDGVRPDERERLSAGSAVEAETHRTDMMVDQLGGLGGALLCLPFIQIGSSQRSAALRILLAMLHADDAGCREYCEEYAGFCILAHLLLAPRAAASAAAASPSSASPLAAAAAATAPLSLRASSTTDAWADGADGTPCAETIELLLEAADRGVRSTAPGAPLSIAPAAELRNDFGKERSYVTDRAGGGDTGNRKGGGEELKIDGLDHVETSTGNRKGTLCVSGASAKDVLNVVGGGDLLAGGDGGGKGGGLSKGGGDASGVSGGAGPATGGTVPLVVSTAAGDDGRRSTSGKARWHPLMLSAHALLLVIDMLPSCAPHVLRRTLEAIGERLTPAAPFAADLARVWRHVGGVPALVTLALLPAVSGVATGVARTDTPPSRTDTPPAHLAAPPEPPTAHSSPTLPPIDDETLELLLGARRGLLGYMAGSLSGDDVDSLLDFLTMTRWEGRRHLPAPCSLLPAPCSSLLVTMTRWEERRHLPISPHNSPYLTTYLPHLSR